MDQMRVIPSKIHGIADYLVGILLILAPTLFGFADEGDAQVWIPRILGIATIVMSLMTDYEWGIIKVIPFQMHLAMDAAQSIILLASPFLFGFIDEPANEWLPHIVVAIGEMAIVALSYPRAYVTNTDNWRT